MADLPTAVFTAIRRRFFDESGSPVSFHLRPKKNTQDDPFDEYLAGDVLANLKGIECIKAPGPLITPDMVLFRPHRCRGTSTEDLIDSVDRIVGLEVKKLERTKQGAVARSSGLDYNTTPPCGRVRVYDAGDEPFDIRGFYLFVCMEGPRDDPSRVELTAAALVDGNLLNADFELYLSIVGERKKRIDLGTYQNGADRARPMLIFANPLGIAELDHAVSLVHCLPRLDATSPTLQLTYEIERTVAAGQASRFYCYRSAADVPADWTVSTLIDPFPTPAREARTRHRGRFRLPFRI